MSVDASTFTHTVTSRTHRTKKFRLGCLLVKSLSSLGLGQRTSNQVTRFVYTGSWVLNSCFRG